MALIYLGAGHLNPNTSQPASFLLIFYNWPQTIILQENFLCLLLVLSVSRKCVFQRHILHTTVCAFVYAQLLQSCPTLCNPMDYKPARLPWSWDSPGKSIRVGCHAILQGIFLTQRWNPSLLGLPNWQLGFLTRAPPPGKPNTTV